MGSYQTDPWGVASECFDPKYRGVARQSLRPWKVRLINVVFVEKVDVFVEMSLATNRK